jgi:hypothetical protein
LTYTIYSYIIYILGGNSYSAIKSILKDTFLQENDMRLVYEDTKKEVQIGDKVELSHGDTATVLAFNKPHKPSSSGKVIVERVGLVELSDGTILSDQPYHREYYVSVIGAVWIEREDRGEA